MSDDYGNGHHRGMRERRACSAMMYTKDQPKIFVNDCLVHSKSSGKDADISNVEMKEMGNMFTIRTIRSRRERSASLPSADISVSNIENTNLVFIKKKTRQKVYYVDAIYILKSNFLSMK